MYNSQCLYARPCQLQAYKGFNSNWATTQLMPALQAAQLLNVVSTYLQTRRTHVWRPWLRESRPAQPHREVSVHKLKAHVTDMRSSAAATNKRISGWGADEQPRTCWTAAQNALMSSPERAHEQWSRTRLWEEVQNELISHIRTYMYMNMYVRTCRIRTMQNKAKITVTSYRSCCQLVDHVLL